MQTADYQYVGSELDLFARAVNWKAYWGSEVNPYVGRRVLDVGAGIGSNIPILCGPRQDRWLALEPDPTLAQRIRQRINSGELPNKVDVEVGTVSDLDASLRFDSIIYIDVLEHIEQDMAELERSAHFLADGGFVLCVSPAYQWLYTAYDDALGHFRRYNRQTLSAATPANLRIERIFYLDSVGILASAANRLLLKSAHPTEQQIAFWDRTIVPVSRLLDRLLLKKSGKSIIAIWRKA